MDTGWYEEFKAVPIIILFGVVVIWMILYNLRKEVRTVPRTRTVPTTPLTHLLNLIIIIGMPLLFRLIKGTLTLDAGLEMAFYGLIGWCILVVLLIGKEKWTRKQSRQEDAGS